MKRQIKRLLLNHETLRTLTDLQAVAAEAPFSVPRYLTCPECAETVWYTCTTEC